MKTDNLALALALLVATCSVFEACLSPVISGSYLRGMVPSSDFRTSGVCKQKGLKFFY